MRILFLLGVLALVIPPFGCGGGDGGTAVVITETGPVFITGTDTIRVCGVSAFSDGSFVVVGTFRGTAAFGAGQPNATMLTSDGAPGDVFIARYDVNLVLQWARRAGGTTSDEGSGIGAVDGDGSCVITGRYGGTMTFGPGEANQTMITEVGGSDLFVARYAANGNLMWAKTAGGTNTDNSKAIAALADGSSFITGNFRGTATFGPGEGNQTMLTSAGNADIFIARYGPNGLLQWAKRAGGTSFDSAEGIDGFANGESVITGEFDGTATFGPGEGNQTMLTGAGISDIFVARYGPNGLLSWVKQATGGGDNDGKAIATLADGTCIATGFFRVTATFGPGEGGQTMLTAAAAEDVFVAKFAANGNLVWARRAGGTGDEQGLAIKTLGDGSCAVCGCFDSTPATFGPGEANQTMLTSDGGSDDPFVARYDALGNLAWVRRAGSSLSEEAKGLAFLIQGYLVVGGYFQSTATFGPGEPNQTVVMAVGSDDGFLARHGPGGNIE